MGINARDSWWIEMMEMRKSIMYLMEVNNCLFWCLEGCPQITQITCRLEGPLWSSILCLRLTILGPWVLGVLAPYQPSETSATPIFARELWNALWTWQTRRPSWWVFGSMNAAQLHEASLQCNDVPTVPTILRRVKWGQAQHDGIPKLVPTTYEHQTTLVIPSVDVDTLPFWVFWYPPNPPTIPEWVEKMQGNPLFRGQNINPCTAQWAMSSGARVGSRPARLCRQAVPRRGQEFGGVAWREKGRDGVDGFSEPKQVENPNS